MPFTYKFGTPVRANLGNGQRVAWVIGPAYDIEGADGPEQKYSVQGPGDGQVHEMAYTGETASDGDVAGGFFTDL